MEAAEVAQFHIHRTTTLTGVRERVQRWSTWILIWTYLKTAEKMGTMRQIHREMAPDRAKLKRKTAKIHSKWTTMEATKAEGMEPERETDPENGMVPVVGAIGSKIGMDPERTADQEQEEADQGREEVDPEQKEADQGRKEADQGREARVAEEEPGEDPAYRADL